MEIIKGKQNKPQRVVIYGPEGIGKSTIASQFPKPLFIDTEGSTTQLDVARTPKPSSWTHIKKILGEIRNDHMGFETLVIDTVDWAEIMCSESVCSEHGHTSVEEFGYGKGYTYVAEEWGRFLNFLTDIRDSGMHIVLLAHAQMRKFEQPDEAGAYDRWELKLSKKCSPLTKEWADMVLFANYKTIVIEVDKKKKAQGRKRVMYTTHHECWDAKNRHDLPEELELKFDAIGHCITAVTAPNPVPIPPIPPVSAPATPPPPAPEAEDDLQYTTPTPKPEPTNTAVPMTDPTAFPAQLWDLMKTNGVTEEEVRRAVAHKGYYPIETPITVYQHEFVDNLCAVWDSVYKLVEHQRKGVAA